MKQVVALFGLLVAVLVLVAWLSKPGVLESFNLFESTAPPLVQEEKTVVVDQAEFRVEVADTDEERNLGLSEREGLEPNQGMLFVFPQNSRPSFWMKNVLFPLDIIWIDDGKVAQITANAALVPKDWPDDKIPVYSPNQLVDYVLEVGGGQAEILGITVGDAVQLPSL